jgi:hypothetical protein
MTRLRPTWLLALALAPFSQAASGGVVSPLVAARVTIDNASELLFAGTDADGGIDDWYLSNGVVQAIIDDAGPQADLVGVVPSPPAKQSEAGFTGGTLIDLGRVGENNDQLAQMFSVGGLSQDNFFVLDDITSETTPTVAKITATGGVLGFAVPAEDLDVVMEYSLGLDDDFLTITTTVTNNGSVNAAPLGGLLDVFIWTDKGPLPFSPAPGLGFDHPTIDISNPLASLEQPPFSAAPGSAGPADGVVDPVSGAVAGEVSYGLLGVQATFDPDGAGATPPTYDFPVDTLFGVSSHELTAFGNTPLCFCGLPPTGTLTYTRRIYVGTRNDVASVANPILQEMATRAGFETGTISGDIDGAESSDVVATGIATRTGGTPLTAFPDDTPVTQFRTGDDGTFSGVVLPVGTYDLEVRSAERDVLTVTGVSVSSGTDTPVTVPVLSGLGTVEFEVFEKRQGPDLAIPAKATFKGRKGDPDPVFARDVSVRELSPGGDNTVNNQSFGGSLAQGNLVYLARGTGSVQVRPGRYEVYASRGPEYTVQKKNVTVKAGKNKRLKFVLTRLLETPDAISGDFHIHSARSLDSSAGLSARVASFAGEGLEVMVSTDHDFHLDYTPVIDELDLEPFITSIVGVEVTGSVPNPPAFPQSTGHINSWPMTVDANARRDGSIEDEFVAPNFIFKRLRDAGGDVIQYNHVRAGSSGLTSIGFFNNMGCGRCENDVDQTCSVDGDCPADPAPQNCTCVGYQTDRPITAAPNDELLSDDVQGNSGVTNPDNIRNIDFDAMEIGNGISPTGYLRLRADWFSLLAQANLPTKNGPVPIIWGTGVSDSHRISIEAAGYMRTYVLGSGDDPAALDEADFDANILAGRMMATTGPFIEATLSDGAGNTAGLGETFTPTSSPLTLQVRVQASNWIPLEEVRVIVDGDVPVGLAFDETTTPAVKKAPKKPLSKGKKSVERFEAAIPLPGSAEDFFVLVEAGQKLDPVPGADPFASLIVPDFVSLAFTNPIFVDLAGDGFDPPGLPPSALARALAPLESEAGRAAARAEEKKKHRHFPIHQLRIPEEAVHRALERTRH